MNPFHYSPYYLKILYFVYLYLEFFYYLIHFHAGDHTWYPYNLKTVINYHETIFRKSIYKKIVS